MNPFREENPDVPAQKLVEDYLWELIADRAKLHFSTVVLRNYEAYLSQREYLQEIVEANALVIQGYIVGMAVRDSSIDCMKRHIDVLREFYDYLVERKLVSENPVAGAQLPDRE
ncbi:MAG: hypothetical protein IBX61_09725 [Thermoleophilia bacterium]|nr:hypothetical protein [Thermoleophilia bacterium]